MKKVKTNIFFRISIVSLILFGAVAVVASNGDGEQVVVGKSESAPVLPGETKTGDESPSKKEWTLRDSQNMTRAKLGFYETVGWPYETDPPFVRIPAQLVSGLPVIPAIFCLLPYTMSNQENIDMGLAVIDAERLYMETPGYYIYTGVGFPLHYLKLGIWDGPLYLYRSMFGN